MICALCHEPILESEEIFLDPDGDQGVVHASCEDMDRSAAFGDWITWEYE